MPGTPILVRDDTGVDAAEYTTGRMVQGTATVAVTGLCPARYLFVAGLARTNDVSLAQPLCASLARKGASMAQVSTGPRDRSICVRPACDCAGRFVCFSGIRMSALRRARSS